MEHRRVQRYRLSLPISFFWGSESNFLEGNGTTRDISIHGVFIETMDTVPKASELWLKIAIPAIREGLKGSEMQGSGRVVRVQADGFAVEAAIGFSGQSKKQKDITNKNSESGTSGDLESLEPRTEEVNAVYLR